MTKSSEPATPGPVTPSGLWTLSEGFLKAYSGTVFKVEPHPAEDLWGPDILHLATDSDTGDVASRECIEINPSPSGIWYGAIDSPKLFLARVGTEDEVLETLLNCLQSKTNSGS